MTPEVLRAFSAALEKLAYTPTSTAADGRVYEALTPESAKRTMKDIPLAILAGGVGYGLGRTAVPYLEKHLTSTRGQGHLKHLPKVLAAAGMALPFAQGMVREGLRARREKANAEAEDRRIAKAHPPVGKGKA